MPASRWPGTEQKKVYSPGLRSTSVESEPWPITSVEPIVFAARVFDRDVVAELLRVGEVDRHFARFGGGGFGRVGEFAARVGFEVEGRRAGRAAFGFVAAAGCSTTFLGGFTAAGVRRVVIVTTAGDEGERGEQQGEQEHGFLHDGPFRLAEWLDFL